MAGLHDDDIPPGSELDATPGFPQHPHRGFETITYVVNGVVDHADTLGASGRYSNGDVQWMTAGHGVCHSEVTAITNATSDNHIDLWQLWLNLPRHSKLCPPHTSMMWAEDVPVLQQGDGVTVKVLASPGSLPANPDSWAHDPQNAVQILHASIPAGATFHLMRAARDSNLTIYVFASPSDDASLTVPDGKQTTTVPLGHAVAYNSGGDSLALRSGCADVEVLVLEGRAIKEPVVAHGPFVMNTQEEIAEAFQSYRTQSWSEWPWSVNAPVHGDAPRFADDGKGVRTERGSNIKVVDCGEVSYMPEMKANGWRTPASRR